MEISNGHHQIMASYPLNEALPDLGCPKATGQLSQETKPRPQQHPLEALRCPRCDSSNTKFCYYNNYSLTQPRYFCKSCRRYWTKGGTLRNVPVGGGCRKNKRSSSSSSSSSPSSSTKKLALRQEHPDNFTALPLPPLSYDPSDLSLAFSNLQRDPFLLGNHHPNPNPSSIPTGHGFLDILRSGLVGPTGLSPAIGGLHGLYYGFGGGSGEVEGGDNGAMLPFNHEGVSVSDGTMAGATHAGASTSHGSSYPASWQGFIIHDGA